MRPAPLLLVLAFALSAAACGGGAPVSGLPRGSEPDTLDPDDFRDRIDHPYWPMAPGNRWVYRERDGEGSEQRVVVTVLPETRTILGIEATVVHDVVTEEGRLVEDTFDWYAQDKEGNVWYLGEATKEYEDGRLRTTAGSWEAGVDGAQPGIILPAHPRPGLSYRQEYYASQAEDAAEVLSVEEKAEVSYGAFDHVLLTKELTPLEPKLLEYKLYARGVGPVLAVTVSGGSDRQELLSFRRGH